MKNISSLDYDANQNDVWLNLSLSGPPADKDMVTKQYNELIQKYKDDPGAIKKFNNAYRIALKHYS